MLTLSRGAPGPRPGRSKHGSTAPSAPRRLLLSKFLHRHSSHGGRQASLAGGRAHRGPFARHSLTGTGTTHAIQLGGRCYIQACGFRCYGCIAADLPARMSPCGVVRRYEAGTVRAEVGTAWKAYKTSGVVRTVEAHQADQTSFSPWLPQSTFWLCSGSPRLWCRRHPPGITPCTPPARRSCLHVSLLLLPFGLSSVFWHSKLFTRLAVYALSDNMCYYEMWIAKM